jgi:hypothetical protein
MARLADLSVARFGDKAKIGVEGEQLTARLIAESVLPGLPSARLINGLRWPGTEHADIDHAVIAGNRIALIDSKMWADGLLVGQQETLPERQGNDRPQARSRGQRDAIR